jgi:hypothetical protein
VLSASLPPIQSAMKVGSFASACCTAVPRPRRMKRAIDTAVGSPAVGGSAPVSESSAPTVAPGMLRLSYSSLKPVITGTPPPAAGAMVGVRLMSCSSGPMPGNVTSGCDQQGSVGVALGWQSVRPT